jgi:hypothetical protein
MAFVDDEVAREYRDAWEAWQKQVLHVHRVFLEDEKLRPDQLKGLLNREARAKERYDTARLKLLGLDEQSFPEGPADFNPFH